MVPQQVTVGPPPLPGGVAAVLRFFFNLPQWFQIAGFIAGVLVAVAVLVVLWRNRAAICPGLLTRRGRRPAAVSQSQDISPCQSEHGIGEVAGGA